MSDLTNAITSINQAAERAENTSDFLDDWSTFDNESYVTNPNNNETVSSAAKQIKDLVDEELPGLIDGVEANAESAAESASSASESMDSASASATTASEASATAVAASESASESEANVTEIESDLNELYEDLSNTVIPDGPNGSDGAEYGFAITDETGQVIHSVSNDGKVTSIETTTYKEKNPNTQQSTIDPYGQMSSSTGLDGSNTITTVSFEEQPDSSSDFVIVDSKGRECLRVDEYGALDTSPTKYGEFVQAQDMFIESYGNHYPLVRQVMPWLVHLKHITTSCLRAV